MTEFQKEFIKDPDAVLEYQFNWATWLGADTISSFSIISTSGITIDSSTNSNTVVTVWLSGGTASTDYFITCRIVTVAGRTDDRTVKISVKHR
jgi:hypothetical protein